MQVKTQQLELDMGQQTGSKSGKEYVNSRLYIVTLLIRVKRLPAMRETQVRSLSWDVPLEKEMAPHSSTLAWKIP